MLYLLNIIQVFINCMPRKITKKKLEQEIFYIPITLALKLTNLMCILIIYISLPLLNIEVLTNRRRSILAKYCSYIFLVPNLI